MRRFLAGFLLFAATVPAGAMDFDFDGYLDLRLVAPGDQTSWRDGGLGKLRYGKGDSAFEFAGGVGEGHLLITPELSAVVVARAGEKDQRFISPLEAYIRYRPVSTTHWRWSIKAGAFFAPFSLENTEIGWSSYWTITPSAINSWYGNELRTVGSEGRLEWREGDGTLSLLAAVYGWNDPAGQALADKGWTLDDQSAGLFDHIREPDATVSLFGGTPPDSEPVFKEIDNRPGWYAGLQWDDADQWHAEIIRYDNEANSAAHNDDYFAWDTRFWNAGVSDKFGEFTVLAQGVSGSTTITPFPNFHSTTNFDSAFVLLGWERDEWRLAARAETFATSGLLGEHGNALTAAASWLPKNWLRITAELIDLDSTRSERTLAGLSPRDTETQAQLSARIYF
jgi:hypothetical protein